MIHRCFDAVGNTGAVLIRQINTLGSNCCTGWTNNACESVNHMLKQRTQCRVNQLPDLIDKLRTLVLAQPSAS